MHQQSTDSSATDSSTTGATAPGTDPAVMAAADFGVGARITLAVMADDFADVITGALRSADSSGLQIATDEVSSFVRGSEQRITEYLCDLIAGAARNGRHVSASVLLSRGCPGEVCRVVDRLPSPAVPRLAATDVAVTAQWALYPLADGDTHGSTADHMRDIAAAIERSRQRGTFVRGDHFVTTLAGDLAEVLGTVVDGWLAAGRHVQHVATHVTIGVNSPTTTAAAER